MQRIAPANLQRFGHHPPPQRVAGKAFRHRLQIRLGKPDAAAKDDQHHQAQKPKENAENQLQKGRPVLWISGTISINGANPKRLRHP